MTVRVSRLKPRPLADAFAIEKIMVSSIAPAAAGSQAPTPLGAGTAAKKFTSMATWAISYRLTTTIWSSICHYLSGSLTREETIAFLRWSLCRNFVSCIPILRWTLFCPMWFPTIMRLIASCMIGILTPLYRLTPITPVTLNIRLHCLLMITAYPFA